MRSSERTECIKSLIKLKQQQEIIEKGLDNFLDSAKLGPEILRDLRNDERSFTSDRKKFASSVRMPAEEIANDLRAIKSVIGALQEGRNIDIDSFRSKLVKVAEKIREFKKDPLFEKLSNEEIELDRDVRDFSSTMHKYEYRNCTGSAKIASRESSRSKTSDSTDCHDYSSLRDFDALVAKTGHTQSWSEEDHLFFLKIRKTTRGVPAMVAAIRKKCPDLTSERIVNHEAWYKVYLELREKRRKTIKDWREKKEAEKRSKLDSAENETGCSKTEENISNLEDAARESVPTVSKSIGKSVIKKDPSGCDKKESLNRWRADKENSRSVEAEKTKLAIESREALKESRRLSRAREIKSAVEAYREKKIDSIASSSTTSVTGSDRVVSKAEASRLMECFRWQDEEFLRRRTALLQSRKSHTSAPVRSRVDVRSAKKSTLMKPTKVWLEKCRTEECRVGLPRQVLYVKDIPKLATCDWRNRQST